jgi:flagella basal body P-ring formation protein FlgA
MREERRQEAEARLQELSSLVQELSGQMPMLHVREGDVRPPTLVTRNATVTIILQTGTLQLSAQGRATEDGARGDTIRIVNTQSNRTIEATVVAPDTVLVQLGRPLAYLDQHKSAQ